ncbi:MAG: hypothetical protein QOI85_2035 [Chloroflexota bacterium]|jgi:hypothetical protein|nr:hypothetical protein [Chloroflexota bacterium]
MEGYSVTEAASVLGVPTERVWELLARGILSGVADGETGMRVFLQPRPAPPAVDEPRRSNGHGDARGAETEASPFRELLTEFRGLTERYGQALLALGEARGEVASLRSRVDVLEARMDLRLPFASPMTAESTWAETSGPATEPKRRASDRPAVPPAEERVHAQGSEAEPVVDDEPDADRSARRKRSRTHFSDEFADALARAEDPSPAVLPDAAEIDAHFATPHHDRDESAVEAEAADAVLPRELPPAESIAVMEPEPELVQRPEPVDAVPIERHGEPERATLAEFVPEPAAEAEPAPEVAAEPEPEAAIVAAPEPEPEPALELAPELELATEPEPEQPSEVVPEPELAAEPEPEREPEPAVELVREPEAEAEREPEPAVEPAPEPELAAEPEPEPAVEPAPEPAAEAQPQVAAESAPEPALAPEQQPAPWEPEPQPTPEELEAPEPEVGVEAPELEVEHEAEERTAPEELASSEPEPARDTIEEQESPLQSPPELEPSPAATETEPSPAAAVAAELASEPSWDQERYTSRIEEPDWWTPEESVWAKPAGSPEPIPAETVPEVPKPAPPDAGAPAPPLPVAGTSGEVEAEAEADSADLEADVPSRVQIDEPAVSNEPDRGEETVLWFGRRPEPTEAAGWPSEDAAGEMEVASTGRRGWVSSEEASTGLPGASELDDALHAFDSLGGERGAAAAESNDAQVEDEPQPARTAPAMWAAPGTRPTQAGELRSPASRAYRRLRRIFPG